MLEIEITAVKDASKYEVSNLESTNRVLPVQSDFLKKELREKYWMATKMTEYIGKLVDEETNMLNNRLTVITTSQQD